MDALSQLEGAYCVLVTMDDTLYAARDPYGYRPLVIGALPTGGLVVASETCALDIVARALRARRGAGRAHPHSRRRDRVVSRLPRFVAEPQPCVFELVYFARPDTRLWGYTVDRARRAFGRKLARGAAGAGRHRDLRSRQRQLGRGGLRGGSPASRSSWG